jgi:AcrR family transcriptional regulator
VVRRKTYHHGNLRDALIEASLDLISESGPKALTLREAARRAGVSHNAPYRHFQDKDALLAAIAAEGFERLAETMEKRIEAGRTPLEWLNLCGRGYLEFAMEAPAHYTVMFGGGLDAKAHPAMAAAAARAFGVLVRSIEDCRAAGAIACDDVPSCARVAWSLVHGIAMLVNSGQLGIPREQAFAFAQRAMDTLREGLQPR